MMPSRLSIRPSGSRERPSSAFVHEGSTTLQEDDLVHSVIDSIAPSSRRSRHRYRNGDDQGAVD
jgi:hypothetical protein